MTKAFNLLDEPWVPVRTLSGEVREVNLQDALLRSREYAALAETSPPNLVALYRLLLVVVHRALTTHHGTWLDKDRARWFREGLPEAPLRAYLEQWRERFWLFHPEHPFMQVAALADAVETKDKLKPWTQIALEATNGNAPVVFDHSVDDSPSAISCATACRSLLGYLQFTPGGLVKTFRDSDKAGALANTAAVLPVGATLHETLVLALHPSTGVADRDPPAWEQPACTTTALEAEPRLATGPNDRYTRLSRAVLLTLEGAGEVRTLRFGAGLALADDVGAPDPMASYRVNKEGMAIRVSFQEGRAIWRDLPSLVPDVSGKFDVPPAVLGWASNVYAALGQWDRPIAVVAAGLASEKAKLLRWRAERMELPALLLTEPDAAATLRLEIRLAESTYYRLRGICADMIADTMPDPKHKDTKAKAKLIQERGPGSAVFFSNMERQLPQLMGRLAEGDVDAAHAGWVAALKDAAERTWEATRRAQGESAATVRAEARAYPRFKGLLNSLEEGESSTMEETTP